MRHLFLLLILLASTSLHAQDIGDFKGFYKAQRSSLSADSLECRLILHDTTFELITYTYNAQTETPHLVTRETGSWRWTDYDRAHVFTEKEMNKGLNGVLQLGKKRSQYFSVNYVNATDQVTVQFFNKKPPAKDLHIIRAFIKQVDQSHYTN